MRVIEREGDMDFEAKPLNPKIGVEITGIDLSQPLSNAVLAEIRSLWVENVVAVFPDQMVDEEAMSQPKPLAA